MEIPEEFCICERIWLKVDVHSDDAMTAAQLIISHINDFLKKKSLIGTCRTLDFIEVIHLI